MTFANGNIYTGENSKLNVYGGNVIGGTAYSYGGVFWIPSGGKVNLAGGTVTDGAAPVGAGIYSHYYGLVTLTGNARVGEIAFTGSSAEALAIKESYEQNMRSARAQADSILANAQKTATARSEEIIGQAQQQAAQLKLKAAVDIEQEKKKAINDAKSEISGLAMAIAGKVVERELQAADQEQLINRFIDELGDEV